jgi:hypothetical protein
MIPKRRKAPKLGVREAPQIRSAGHCQWIRGHWCVIDHPTMCQGGIECAHVRTGTDGGTSLKPSDCWTIPLCRFHHAEQHRKGERAFEQLYKIDMKKIAAALWAKSPHAKKLRTP